MSTKAAAFNPVERRFRVGAILAGMALTLIVAGCDYPTEPPIFESRWVLPFDTDLGGIDVAELLPTGVTITPDESAFVIDVGTVAFNESLGNLCPACALVNGLTVPKPAFTGGLQSTASLPAEVDAVTVSSGTVRISLTNGLNFDPLRPGAGQFGTFTVTITDAADSDVLGGLTVLGQDSAFAPAATSVLTIPFNPTTLNGDVQVDVSVFSPDGDPILMDTSMRLDAQAETQDLRVTSASVDVAGTSVDLDNVELDVEDIDSGIADNVAQGALNLTAQNPFGVGAQATVQISGPTIQTIVKSVSLPATPLATLQIAFTGEELQSFLGEEGVTLSGTATVDPAASVATVTPAMKLEFEAELDLTLEIGS